MVQWLRALTLFIESLSKGGKNQVMTADIPVVFGVFFLHFIAHNTDDVI